MNKGTWVFLFFFLSMITGVILSLYGQWEREGVVIAWASLGFMLLLIYKKDTK